MKFAAALSVTSLVSATYGKCAPHANTTVPAMPGAPDQCCCLTYKAACTMGMERMFHIKLFYNRKQGITQEQFNRYWAYNHAELATPFHLRLGVVKYSQYHSTPEFRDFGSVENAPPILEFDGAAEFWVHNLETFQSMGSDPEYLKKIQPDEANFIDPESIRMIIGVDYIVVESQNTVMEHGRSF